LKILKKTGDGMKKFVVFLLLVFSFLLFAEDGDYPTATQMQLEQELANRVERVMEPYLGHCIVSVKLNMRYPSVLRAISQMGDTEEVMEDTQVARTKAAILSEQRKKYEHEQTQILGKVVTIYISRALDERMDIFIRQNIENLLNLDNEKGDVLVIKRILPTTQAEQEKDTPEKTLEKAVKTEKKTSFSEGFNNIIFLVMFHTSISKILSTRTNVNVTGFDKLIRLQANMKSGMTSSGGSSESRAARNSSKEPVYVQMVENKDEKEIDDSLDFSYLQNLSIEQFIQITKNENPEDIACLIVNLSQDFVQKYFEHASDKMPYVLQALLKDTQRTKTDVEALQKKYFKKYKDQLIKSKLHYNGKEKLVHVINASSPEFSKKIITELETLEKEIAEEIRKKVFLLEDILLLEDDDIERIITGVNHDLLVEFLMSSGDDIKQKFFKHMSPRAISIIEEDMELHGDISEEDKELSVSEMLNSIRTIMNYK
jgi:flagellar motor switch protein FliG